MLKSLQNISKSLNQQQFIRIMSFVLEDD